MKKLLLLIFVLFISVLCACQITVTMNMPKDPSPSPIKTPEATKEPQSVSLLGKVEGNTYINEALGLTAAIPDGWEVADEEGLSYIFKLSADLMKETTGLESGAEMGIMYCSKYGVYSADMIPNINFVLSNKSDTMAIIRGQDTFNSFLEQYRTMMAEVFPGCEVKVEGERSVMLGNYEYSVFHIMAENESGLRFYEEQYFKPVADYVLIITVSYYDTADKALLVEFVESIEYES